MGLFETRRPHLKEILLIQVHWWVRYTFLFPLLHAFHANWKPPWGLFPNRTGAFMNLSLTKYTMFPSLLIIDSIRAWLNLHINILITIRSMIWVTLFLIVFKERKKWKMKNKLHSNTNYQFACLIEEEKVNSPTPKELIEERKIRVKIIDLVFEPLFTLGWQRPTI